MHGFLGNPRSTPIHENSIPYHSAAASEYCNQGHLIKAIGGYYTKAWDVDTEVTLTVDHSTASRDVHFGFRSYTSKQNGWWILLKFAGYSKRVFSWWRKRSTRRQPILAHLIIELRCRDITREFRGLGCIALLWDQHPRCRIFRIVFMSE